MRPFESSVVDERMDGSQVGHGDSSLRLGDLIGVKVLYADTKAPERLVSR